jgi:hypothetical protein
VSAIDYVHEVVIPAAYKMLPAKMEIVNATAMLLAIGLQESRFEFRQQIGGPALSFWQAEPGGGLSLVFDHPTTRDVVRQVLNRMAYAGLDSRDPHALEHNDILTAIRARLLLWTHPDPLPDADEPDLGWEQYNEIWRPGNPRRETWDAFFADAWSRELNS